MSGDRSGFFQRPFHRTPVLRVLSTMALAGLSAACAVNFSLAPTVLDIDPARRTTAETRFVNAENTAMSFTVSVMKWENQDGQDVYTPTRDVLVTPSQFTLAPLGVQVIRVGLQKHVGAGELTYRVFLRQVPPDQAAAEQTATSMADVTGAGVALIQLVNISLPIYGAPAAAAPDLHYSVTVHGPDLLLNVQNAGNRHFTYRQLKVTSDTGKTFDLPSKALLSGAAMTLELSGFAGARTLDIVSLDAQGKELRAQIPVQP